MLSDALLITLRSAPQLPTTTLDLPAALSRIAQLESALMPFAVHAIRMASAVMDMLATGAGSRVPGGLWLAYANGGVHVRADDVSAFEIAHNLIGGTEVRAYMMREALHAERKLQAIKERAALASSAIN